jgi:hypothetical protein
MWRLAGIILIAFYACIAAANHQAGLHLQLPNKLIDIRVKDVEEMQVFHRGPKFASIMLKLNRACADRLYKATQLAVGQSAVWIWNGRVLSVETLKTPIKDDLTVHNFTAFEVEDFEKAFPLSALNGAHE